MKVERYTQEIYSTVIYKTNIIMILVQFRAFVYILKFLETYFYICVTSLQKGPHVAK